MIVDLMILAIRLVTPIILASIGAMFCEKSGIMNLGIDGMMLAGAFVAMLGSYYFENAWFGVLLGILAGVAVGFIHAVITVEFGGNQTISGLGINLFVTGITGFLIRAIFNTTISPTVASVQRTDILAGIPVIGTKLAQISPITYITFLLIPVVWYVMGKTIFGLRVDAVGDDPKTIETAGVIPWNYRYLCILICGALAGLGGSYLSIGQMNRFSIDMTAGRGMIALVAVKMGKWKALGILGATLFFGVFDALQVQMQINNVLSLPTDIIQTIPYVCAFIMLVMVPNQNIAPKAMGTPYVKNKYKI